MILFAEGCCNFRVPLFNYSTAVIPDFAGIFDGNGHTISHLMIEVDEDLGLFGFLGYGAEVRDLGVFEVEVSGSVFFIGGLAGYIRYSHTVDIISSFWDVETSGLSSSYGGIGKTTAEMQTASTFLGAGWDFVYETANGTYNICWILEGQGYPRLWWETFSELEI